MIEYAWGIAEKGRLAMDDLLFGGGWLDELLREAAGSPKSRTLVREQMRAFADREEGMWESEWKSVDELLEKEQIGPALKKAMESVSRTVRDLTEALGEGGAGLDKPFSPFLIRGREIRKVLHPPEDIAALYRARDELDVVIGLEMINDARRLLASWSAGVWGDEPLELISRLEGDLNELRQCQILLQEEDDEEGFDLEFSEKEIELADRLAALATRFAHDLMDLHLLNAKNPEVPMRFNLLWHNVRQLQDGKSTPAAAFEALQVLEEAMQLAGLGGGELLPRVDLLYERFSAAEDLRQAVDHLDAVSRDDEGVLSAEQGREYIEVIASALGDLGLDVG